MDGRLWLLVALLSLGPLAGCFGAKAPDCPTCAAPTDASPVCPNCTPPAAKPPDLNDSGFVLPDVWRVGDGWDYASNQSRFRDIRVTGEAVVNGTTYVRVREHVGIRGNPPQSRTETWFEQATLSRKNLTFVGGTLTMNFTPRDPSAGFTRNGTFSYNETTHDRQGTEIARWFVRANVHYIDEQTVRMRWGFATGGVVEYRTLRETADGKQERELLVRQVSREWLNDLLRLEPTGEQWELVHAKVGGNELSVLDPIG